MGSPISTRPTVDVNQVRRVKEWVRVAFAVDDAVSLLVTQLECKEQNCPPLETVIAILDTPGQPRQFKLHKGVADVTEDDVRRFARFMKSLDCPGCSEC